MDKMTIEQFEKIPLGIFAKGEIIDDETGINLTRSHQILKWVAVKGFANDWAIYAHWATGSYDFVEVSGDKVQSKENIQKVVPCTDEVYARYRH